MPVCEYRKEKIPKKNQVIILIEISQNQVISLFFLEG